MAEWRRDVLPLVAMITVEFTNVGLSTIFKAATLRGMSFYAFIVYSHVVAALVLLPLSLALSRDARRLPPFTFSLFCKILGLGLIGVAVQVLLYAGIDYASPTLASAIGNLTPAFTFILAVLFRMEKVALRSSISQAKLAGTLVSISGAFVVVFYKGPTVISTPSSPSLLLPQASPQKSWVFGGTLLATQYLLLAIWYICQTKTIKLYPSEPLVVLLYNVCVIFMSIPVCFYGDPNLSSWRLRPDIGLAAVIYSGFLGSGFSTMVHTWGLRIKGPLYITIFRPLSIIIAATMGFIFLGDNLYLGSVIGAVTISIGFYAVMWGKAKEIRAEEEKYAPGSSLKAPLIKEVQ